ncbi:MAG: DNA topoisomerase IV [Bacteroidetes bacterium]|jgi:hypothetical protein|nr:DNA topoisomerase IV [Bacteroidota bacterium]
MRVLISFSFLIILFTGCYNKDRNCDDFRTGKFEFEAISGTEIFRTTIVRNDSIEIDYFDGKIDTSSIRWINNCEYILKKINPRNQAEKKAIHIKILSTTENEYTFEFKEVGKSTSSQGTARRVRD